MVVETPMLRQFNAITKIILCCLTLSKLGNIGWHLKKQRWEKRVIIQILFQFLVMSYSLYTAPILVKHMLFGIISKSFVSLWLRRSHIEELQPLWHLVTICLYLVSVPTHVDFDIVDYNHVDSVSKKLHLWSWIFYWAFVILEYYQSNSSNFLGC